MAIGQLFSGVRSSDVLPEPWAETWESPVLPSGRQQLHAGSESARKYQFPVSTVLF